MNIRILYYFLIGCFCCSCGNKASESTDLIPEIRLDPEHAGTLKVSDYIDRVDVCLLKGALFFRVSDFMEYPQQYVVLAYDHPDFLIGKPRFYMFDKEGHFTSVIGEVGRGAGEYQSIFNRLQINRDSVIYIIDHNKYLALGLNGEVVEEKKINAFGSSNVGAFPECVWNDSLIVLYTSSDLGKLATGMYKDAGKKVSPYLLEFYSLNTDRIIRSYFPMEEVRGLSVKNALYDYRDTLCFYHDKDQIIYRVFPDRLKACYRIDKGKYDRILSLEEYRECLVGNISHAVFFIGSCNETDKYVLGNYVFKSRAYSFIYNKQTRQTMNYRAVDNDLLGVDGRNGKNSFLWQSGLSFKPDCLWLTIKKGTWIKIIEQAKSRLNAEEWKAYCEAHPDFIRIYEELRQDKEAVEKPELTASGDEEEKVVLLRYYFKK